MSEASSDTTGAEAKKPEDLKNYGVAGSNIIAAIKALGKPLKSK